MDYADELFYEVISDDRYKEIVSISGISIYDSMVKHLISSGSGLSKDDKTNIDYIIYKLTCLAILQLLYKWFKAGINKVKISSDNILKKLSLEDDSYYELGTVIWAGFLDDVTEEDFIYTIHILPMDFDTYEYKYNHKDPLEVPVSIEVVYQLEVETEAYENPIQLSEVTPRYILDSIKRLIDERKARQ